ncbi:MAG: phosphatidylserine decarboxylase family protein [Bacteroidales bacterium]|nr:phosphatidylserine decarboxylase family protein [Bacteroidales bacterium]
MHIHKEGYSVIKWFLLGLIGLNLLVFLLPLKPAYSLTIGTLSLGLLFLVVRFFRVPHRRLISDESLIISPADGKVVAIEETTEDEYFKCRMIQISIFMSIWNVHVNWNPISGSIEYHKHHPGKYLIAKHPKSSLLNERASTAIQKDPDRAIMVRQIAGAVARRIISYTNPVNEVQQASELGIIRFGSRVDVFLPVDVKIKVRLSDKVQGRRSVLASW